MSRIPLPRLIALSIVLASIVPASASVQQSVEAEATIARSRQTQATYALYGWNWIRDFGGVPMQGWSAEFHRGHLHRVETPDARAIADCRARTGVSIVLSTGETRSGETVANSACGVNANPEATAASLLPRRESRFGAVDMVQLLDPREKRSYAIDDRGVLVAAEIFPRDPAGLYCVQNEAVAVEAELPEEDIFSEKSLERSVVPERYRSAPDSPAANLWTSPFSCF